MQHIKQKQFIKNVQKDQVMESGITASTVPVLRVTPQETRGAMTVSYHRHLSSVSSLLGENSVTPSIISIQGGGGEEGRGDDTEINIKFHLIKMKAGQ